MNLSGSERGSAIGDKDIYPLVVIQTPLDHIQSRVFPGIAGPSLKHNATISEPEASSQSQS